MKSVSTKTMLALFLAAAMLVGQIAATSTRSLVEYECHDCHDPCHDCHDCHECHDPCHDCHDCHDCHHEPPAPEPEPFLEYAEAISTNEGGSSSFANAEGTYTTTGGFSDAAAFHLGTFGRAEAEAGQTNSAQAFALGSASGSETNLGASAFDGFYDESCDCWIEEVSYAEVGGEVNTYAVSDGFQFANAEADGGAQASGVNVPFTADGFEGSYAGYGGSSYSEANPFAGAYTTSGFDEGTLAVYLGAGDGFAEGDAAGEAGGYACIGFGCTDKGGFPAETVMEEVVEP